MGGQTLDTVDSEKDLGIMISSDLKSSNQCIQACSKASNMLWYDKKDDQLQETRDNGQAI